MIKENGTYRLSNVTANDGAIPGKYEVSVSPPETAGPSERIKNREGAKGTLVEHSKNKVVSFEQPKNKVVTVEKQTNDIPIELHRRK